MSFTQQHDSRCMGPCNEAERNSQSFNRSVGLSGIFLDDNSDSFRHDQMMSGK